ncbi:P-loop containing nucleoside triphosphate hydrolase protein [Baffinella frigidus]|nr:P-loop containing nucleoside triphosphate hydrolase protein [Cryptophyta sp. CCMP2293]
MPTASDAGSAKGGKRYEKLGQSESESDWSRDEKKEYSQDEGETDVEMSEAEEDEAPKQITPLRLLKFGKPELPLVISATFLSAICAFLNMSQNFFVGWLVDIVRFSDLSMRQDQLNWITFVLLAIYIADAMLALFSGVLYTIAASRCSCRLRSLVLRNMLRQDVAFFDTVRIGELLNRLSTDTEVIQSVVTSNLVGWFIPSVQVLDNIRTVRSFVTEEAEIQNYSDKINVSYFVAKKRAWISGGLGAVSSMASDACILLALWYGGQMIFAGVITTGDLISYMLFALQTVFAFQSLLSIFPQFMEAIGASVRVFELLDRVPRVNYDGGIIPPHGIEGRVTFDNVHFHYPSRPDAEVLDGVSCDVVPGKTMAIVGPSGSGKSTSISLISRFYDVDKGKVMIDGVDVRTYDPQWLRMQIGLVSQEPVLFAMSIEENIMYGSEGATMANVQRAAKMANAHDFIMRIPDAYKAQVGERGVMLSGGQRQRIAISRAVLKDPKILLLDEATSALDSENEKLVQEALDRLMVGRTSVVIAHRLSTIVDSDQIIVIQNGRIVERGTHDELIRMNGVYKRLGRRQFGLKNKLGDVVEPKAIVVAKEGDASQDVSSAVELIRRTLQQRRRNNSVQQVAARVQQMRTEPERLKVLVRDLQTAETNFQAAVKKIQDLSKP